MFILERMFAVFSATVFLASKFLTVSVWKNFDCSDATGMIASIVAEATAEIAAVPVTPLNAIMRFTPFSAPAAHVGILA